MILDGLYHGLASPLELEGCSMPAKSFMDVLDKVNRARIALDGCCGLLMEVKNPNQALAATPAQGLRELLGLVYEQLEKAVKMGEEVIEADRK